MLNITAVMKWWLGGEDWWRFTQVVVRNENFNDKLEGEQKILAAQVNDEARNSNTLVALGRHMTKGYNNN